MKNLPIVFALLNYVVLLGNAIDIHHYFLG